MKRALIDKNGLPIAFFDTEIHGKAIPAHAVELSEAQWQEFIDNQGARRWDSAKRAVVQYTPPPEPPADEATARIREFNAACDAELASLNTGYPRGEIATWDKQEREARAYSADNAASMPLITAMAEERGLSVAELAERIIAKADAYTQAAAAAIGKRQRLNDELAAILADGTLSDDKKHAAIKALAW